MVIIADCIKSFGKVCIGDMPICFTDIYSPIGYRHSVFFSGNYPDVSAV